MKTFISSLGIFFITVALVFGSFHIQAPLFVYILGSTKITLAMGLLLLLLGRDLTLNTAKLIAPAGIFLLGISHIATHKHFFLQSTPFRLNYIVAILLGIVVARSLGLKKSSPLVLGLSLALPLAGFFITSKGDLLFSDDHPSFLYRLLLLWEEFPSIPFYSPQWSGGYDAREFFPSGALSPFFLGYPIFFLLGIKESYNFLASFIIFLLPALSVYLASRKLGQSSTASYLSATLAACSSSLWFKWGLTYGTLGFLVSASLAPLCYAFAVKFKESNKIFGVLLFSFCLFWPLGGIIILPALLLLLFKRAFSFLLILSAIHFLWIPVFLSASKVGSFVQAQNTERQKPQLNESPVDAFRQNFERANPLILLLGALAVLRRRFLSLASVYLLVLGVGVPFLKPQLEFERFLVVLFLTLSIPVGSILSSVKKGQFLLIAAFLVSIFQLFMISLNKTPVSFSFEGAQSKFLVSELKRLKPEGRVMFAGFILHELDGGHVAPLPELTGAMMLASRYQHDTWKYQDIIPESFRARGSKGINEYLELYNVEYIITHDEFWGNWYGKRRKSYEIVSKEGRFKVFRRLRFSSDWTLEGEAMSVVQNRSSIELVPKTEEIVIKFNYFPFLTASSCKLEKDTFSSEISFLRLKNCPVGEKIVIKSVSPFKRLLK